MSDTRSRRERELEDEIETARDRIRQLEAELRAYARMAERLVNNNFSRWGKPRRAKRRETP
jgi:predicted  nucleic acid-binding Zn-ribbon protein